MADDPKKEVGMGSHATNQSPVTTHGNTGEAVVKFRDDNAQPTARASFKVEEGIRRYARSPNRRPVAPRAIEPRSTSVDKNPQQLKHKSTATSKKSTSCMLGKGMRRYATTQNRIPPAAPANIVVAPYATQDTNSKPLAWGYPKPHFDSHNHLRNVGDSTTQDERFFRTSSMPLSKITQEGKVRIHRYQLEQAGNPEAIKRSSSKSPYPLGSSGIPVTQVPPIVSSIASPRNCALTQGPTNINFQSTMDPLNFTAYNGPNNVQFPMTQVPHNFPPIQNTQNIQFQMTQGHGNFPLTLGRPDINFPSTMGSPNFSSATVNLSSKFTLTQGTDYFPLTQDPRVTLFSSTSSHHITKFLRTPGHEIISSNQDPHNIQSQSTMGRPIFSPANGPHNTTLHYANRFPMTQDRYDITPIQDTHTIQFPMTQNPYDFPSTMGHPNVLPTNGPIRFPPTQDHQNSPLTHESWNFPSTSMQGQRLGGPAVGSQNWIPSMGNVPGHMNHGQHPHATPHYLEMTQRTQCSLHTSQTHWYRQGNHRNSTFLESSHVMSGTVRGQSPLVFFPYINGNLGFNQHQHVHCENIVNPGHPVIPGAMHQNALVMPSPYHLEYPIVENRYLLQNYSQANIIQCGDKILELRYFEKTLCLLRSLSNHPIETQCERACHILPSVETHEVVPLHRFDSAHPPQPNITSVGTTLKGVNAFGEPLSNDSIWWPQQNSQHHLVGGNPTSCIDGFDDQSLDVSSYAKSDGENSNLGLPADVHINPHHEHGETARGCTSTGMGDNCLIKKGKGKRLTIEIPIHPKIAEDRLYKDMSPIEEQTEDEEDE